MVITKKHLPRRTFLRGMGVTLALPLSTAMVPAFTATVKTRRQADPAARRHVPPQRHRRHGGVDAHDRRRRVRALADSCRRSRPFKERLLVLTHLDDEPGKPIPGEGIGEHARGCASWLSGVHPRKTAGADVYAGVTMDQIAAAAISARRRSSPRSKSASIRWRAPAFATAATAVRIPTRSRGARPRRRCRRRSTRARVFERLFGEGGTPPSAWPASRKTAASSTRVTERVAGLQKRPRRARPGQAGPVSRRGSRRRTPIQQGRRTERSRAGRRRAAVRRPGDVRGARRADVRPAAAGVSERPDARHHLHVRRARSAPAPIRRSASPTRTTGLSHHQNNPRSRRSS